MHVFKFVISVLCLCLCACSWARGDGANARKTLVVVPGMSPQPNRTNTVLQNMALLREHDSDFHCLVHHYSARPMPRDVLHKFEAYGCSLEHFHESNQYADYLKTVLPSSLRFGQFGYVMILLDDVELQSTFR